MRRDDGDIRFSIGELVFGVVEGGGFGGIEILSDIVEEEGIDPVDKGLVLAYPNSTMTSLFSICW